MGQSANELARLFRERDNPNIIGTMVGTVISTSPISVSIGKINISGSNLIVANRLLDRTENVSIDGIEKIITYKGVLKPGDRLIINPTADKQTFIAVDKVG